MRIGVCFDLKADHLAAGMSEEDAAEFDSEVTVAAICAALEGLGHRVERIGHVRRLIETLAAGARWDAVFNICEGQGGMAREAQVPAVLDAYGIPYVLSDPLTCALTLDKAMTKRLVRDGGVMTADFEVIDKPADIAGIALPYPLFLKPVAEGSGKGVDARSKVANREAMRAQAEYLLERFRQPVLVETFLPGREFTVALIGSGDDAEVLGISELKPLDGFVGAGYGFANKSEGWEDKVKFSFPADETARASGQVALDAWRLLRGRDCGRADIRCDGDGVPHFIELNPLAGIRPDYSDLCLIARHAGLSYGDLIGRIMESFLRRHPDLRG